MGSELDLRDTDLTVLHHRYRQSGGEERCERQLTELLRDSGVNVRALQRLSGDYDGFKAPLAAAALVAGGAPPAVPKREHDKQIVHAHNIHPTFGWRTLRRFRDQGAAIVLQLHNYRLFCANGLAFRDGHDCFDCASRASWNGVRHNCRDSALEAVPYALGIGLWQRRLLGVVDVLVAPTGALLDDLRTHAVIESGEVVPNWIRDRHFAPASRAADGEYALMATRVTTDKGIEIALRAAAEAAVPLKIAGDGPALAAMQRLAGELGGDVEFVGRLSENALARLRVHASMTLVPSLWREVQPFAAIESLAAGIPVVASDTPALRELTDDDLVFPRGDHAALAAVMRRLHADRAALRGAGNRALARAQANHSERSARERLARVYELALARRATAAQRAS